MAKNFIQGAIKHPGALTAQAKRAGEPVRQFAEEHKHDAGVTGQRARLAITVEGLHPAHQAAIDHAKRNR